MDDKGFSHLPFLQTCNFFGPPEIEKILDTFVTKNNQRYYKVKWVKVCWVGENELSYMGNAVDSFWAQYTQYVQENILFEPSLDDATTGIPCNKDIGNEAISDHSIDLQECGSAPPIDSILLDIKSKKIFETCGTSESDTNDYMPHFDKADGCISETVDFEKAGKISTAISHTLGNIHVNITESSCNNIPNIEDVSNIQYIACSLCKVSFSSTKELLDHQTFSKCTENVYKCPLCNIEFKQEGRLEKHISGHKIKRCQVCGKEFTRLAHLSTHLLIHENIRPWSCNDCDKSFTDKSSLTKHQLVHNGIRIHQCDVCNKTFQRAQHLRRHKESHDGVKKFKCHVCDRTFQLNNSLKIHMNTHSGEKPHKCTVCWRPFADKSALKRHMLIHEKKKAVKCNNFNKEFSGKTTYDIHNCKLFTDEGKQLDS